MSLKPVGIEMPKGPDPGRPNPATHGAPRTVFADDQGRHFVQVPTEDGVATVPYIPGSPPAVGPNAMGTSPGFVPLSSMPSPTTSAPNGDKDFLQGMIDRMPSQMATNWLGPAAMQSIVAGGTGGALDGAMGALGMSNPLAAGPMAGILGTALQQAGVGALQPMLPALGSALMGGSTAGLADAAGRLGMNQLLNATGLGKIPGAGLAANLLGDAIGDQLQNMLTGGLDQLTNGLSDAFSNLSLDSCVADVENALGNLDPSAITSQGLDAAAGQLMNQWKVDDESSAAEQIAHKNVSDHLGDAKDAVKDPQGTLDRLKKFFGGEPVAPDKPLVRMGDADDGGDVSMMGVASIWAEKKPISRITDMVAGPKAPPPGMPILEGKAMVLTAELPTAFVTGKTAVPSVMVAGAATVFVGGATAAISPPAKKAPPTAQNNAPPAKPQGPLSTSSGSAADKQAGSGQGFPSGNANTTGANVPGSQPSPTTNAAPSDSPNICSAPDPNDPGPSSDDSHPMCSQDSVPVNTEQCYGPSSGLDEYQLSNAMIREAQEAERLGIAENAHNYVQKMRQDLDGPLGDDPALLNSHAYLKGQGLGEVSYPFVADALCTGYYSVGKQIGLDRLIQLTNNASNQLDQYLGNRPSSENLSGYDSYSDKPSPYRYETAIWCHAGVKGESPTRAELVPPPPTPPPPYVPPPYHLPGQVSPKNPNLPLGPGNIIYH